MPSVSLTFVTAYSVEEALRILNEALPKSRYYGLVQSDGNFKLINKSEAEGRLSGLNLLPEMSGVLREDAQGSKLHVRIHTKRSFFRNYAFYAIIFFSVSGFLVFDAVENSYNLRHAAQQSVLVLIFLFGVMAVTPALEFFSELNNFKKFLQANLNAEKAKRSD